MQAKEIFIITFTDFLSLFETQWDHEKKLNTPFFQHGHFERRLCEKQEDFRRIRGFCLPREGFFGYYGRKTSAHFRKSSENNEICPRLSEIFGIFREKLSEACKIFLLIQLDRSRCSKNVFFFLSHGRQHDFADHGVITAHSDVHGDSLIECQPGSDQDIVSPTEHPR